MPIKVSKGYLEKELKSKTIVQLAKDLQVGRTTLYKKLKYFGIENKPKITIDYIVSQIRIGKTIVDLANEFNLNRSAIYKILNENNLNKKNITFNENLFDKIDSESKSYWLGFIMADGCVSMTHSPKLLITLNKKDKTHLEKFHQALDSILKIHEYKNTIQSQHYSKKICNDLIKVGCTPKKSLTLKFPKINFELLNHFVRGYFDGDGCASMSNKKQKTPQLRISFIGTEQFLDKLQKIFGTYNKLRLIGTNKKNMKLEINGNKKAGRIAKWMYQNSTIYLERKKEVCHSHI